MSNVLLIFPNCHTNPLMNKSNLAPPLGILTLAAYLKKANIDVKILDERIEDDFYQSLDKATKEKPIFVGITTMSGSQLVSAKKISIYLKNNYNSPIVWGGVHPSIKPENTISEPYIDYVAVGEGDNIIVDLTKAIKQGLSINKIKGIYYKKDNMSFYTGSPAKTDMDKVPPIPFDLVDLEKYRANTPFFNFSDNLFLPVQTSRGCNGQCTFCSETVDNRRWRYASPDKVIKDIEYIITNYKINCISFYDDNFFVNSQRSKSIIEKIIAKKLHIEWYTNATSNFINKCTESYIADMEKSGLKSLTIGAESGSDRILKRLQKHVTVQKFLETNEKLSKTSIIAQYFSIAGLPFDTEEDFRMTGIMLCKLALKNANSRFSSFKLITTPGSAILKDCEAAGFKIPTDIDGWSKITDIDKMPVYNHKIERLIKKYNYLPYLGQSRGLNIAIINKLTNLFLKIAYLRMKNRFDLFLVEKYIVNFVAYLMYKYYL